MNLFYKADFVQRGAKQSWGLFLSLDIHLPTDLLIVLFLRIVGLMWQTKSVGLDHLLIWVTHLTKCPQNIVTSAAAEDGSVSRTGICDPRDPIACRRT